jgi:hypothetical protein
MKTWIKKLMTLAFSLTAMALLTSQACGSDPVGIYGIIDKVVLEPNESAPETIQIWGAFSFAEGRGNTYAAPTGGYVYYKLGKEKQEVARKEWSDLRAMAGKEEVVGFGTRWDEKGKVRKPDEKAANPDVYPLGFGLQKVRGQDYEPVKKLIAFHKEYQAATKKVSQVDFPRQVILCTSDKTARGMDRQELKENFSLGSDEFILSGGPSPADPIVVDDDLVVSIGGRKSFVDDDGCRSDESRPRYSRSYEGTPLLLRISAGEKIQIMATDRGASDALLGELYLHGRDGWKAKVTDKIVQASAERLPSTFFSKEVTPSKLTALK